LNNLRWASASLQRENKVRNGPRKCKSNKRKQMQRIWTADKDGIVIGYARKALCLWGNCLPIGMILYLYCTKNKQW
jgi:hypothetical protein